MPNGHLDRLHAQHQRIRESLADLVGCLSLPMTRATATGIHCSVGVLAQAWTEHLLTEDDLLYPELTRRTDRRVNEGALRFFRDLTPLSRQCGVYILRWNSPEGIRNHYDTFVKDTLVLSSSLILRMSKEEKELFPLLDESAEATSRCASALDALSAARRTTIQPPRAASQSR